MNKVILSLLIVLGLALAGCGDKKATKPSGGSSSKGGAMNNTVFPLTIDCLNRLEEFQSDTMLMKIKQQIEELDKAGLDTKPTSSTLLAGWPQSDTMRQIVDRLDQWVRNQPPPKWEKDAMLDELPEPLRQLPVVTGVDKMDFGPFDGYYLQEATFLRDVAAMARGKSIDPLQRAGLLFDWTVRNLQLDEERKDRVPQFPWEALFFGHGTAWERAWVFVLLARQEGIDAAVLAISQEDGTPRPWCVAVRIGGKAYLFDPAWGLPIPGPDGVKKGEKGRLDIAPATLEQLAADESLLKRMNLDADHPYPVKQEDLKNVVALIEASPLALSRRMATVESRLQGKQKMSLTASATEEAKLWKATPGVPAAKLWLLPYMTVERRSALQPREIIRLLGGFMPFYAMPSDLLYGEGVLQDAAKTPKDLQADIYKGSAAQDAGKKKPNPLELIQDTDEMKAKRMIEAMQSFAATYSAPLYKGRVLHLKGQFSGGEGEKSAISYYQMSRPSPEEMEKIYAKQFAIFVRAAIADDKELSPEEAEEIVRNVVQSIMTGRRLENETHRKLAEHVAAQGGPSIDWLIALVRAGKVDASYWLGLVTYENGGLGAAVDYFAKRTLDDPDAAKWTDGARYNLARSIETAGAIPEAVTLYRQNSKSPDALGQLLRAKWLEEVNEKKAAEATGAE
jgi:hypothetical protein